MAHIDDIGNGGPAEPHVIIDADDEAIVTMVDQEDAFEAAALEADSGDSEGGGEPHA
jgi:hypothetical protein